MEERTYIQCLNCGHVHIVDYFYSFDESIINVLCPKCEHNHGLNCGHNEMDLIELKDPYLDECYF